MFADIFVGDSSQMMGVSIHTKEYDFDIQVRLLQNHAECSECDDCKVYGCDGCMCEFDRAKEYFSACSVCISSRDDEDKAETVKYYKELFNRKYLYFDDAFFQYVKLVNEAQEKVRAFEAGQKKKEAVCDDH